MQNNPKPYPTHPNSKQNVAPYPKWASGIKAMGFSTNGSDELVSACLIVAGSRSLAHDKTFFPFFVALFLYLF